MIAIETRKLEAALLFAGKNDIRQVMNTVFINGPANRVEATDTHRAIMIDQDLEGAPAFLIPSDVVATAVKMAKAGKQNTIKIELNGNMGTIGGLAFSVLNLTFPAIGGLVPMQNADLVPSAASMNPKYYGDAHKARDLVEENKLVKAMLFECNVYQAGKFSADQVLGATLTAPMVHFGEGFTALIMPVRP